MARRIEESEILIVGNSGEWLITSENEETKQLILQNNTAISSIVQTYLNSTLELQTSITNIRKSVIAIITEDIGQLDEITKDTIV